MKRRENAKKAGLFCVILILVLVMILSGLRILESTVLLSEKPQEGTAGSSKTVTVDGVDYYPRRDITVMLIMGIDQFGPVQSSGSYNNPGTADMVMLAIFDEKQQNVRILSLNRDTMLEMPVLGIGGKEAGTRYGQLALAHSYGSGLEDSCENVKNTVSRFLSGLSIDYYVAMNMDAISILNDAVGGVAVEVVDDFSAVDPTIGKGQITLTGQQAVSFVQTRKEVGNQLNISRMERQKVYVEGFLSKLREKLESSEGFAVSVYEEVSDYVVTDVSVNVFSSLLQRYADYALEEIVTPQGENVLGEQYYEFCVDEEALDALILRLFYKEK